MLKTLLVAALTSGAALAASTAGAQSRGYMRMPSTFAQYVGCGYGAGHHAPIVRTPLQRPDRVQRVMLVAPCEGLMPPAGYAPIGCYGGACGAHDAWEYPEPSAVMMTPQMAAPPLPAAAPAPPAGAAGAPLPVPPPAATMPTPDRAAWRMVFP